MLIQPNAATHNNPHKRRHNRWKLSQAFFAKYTCVEMASRKVQTYQNKAKDVCQCVCGCVCMCVSFLCNIRLVAWNKKDWLIDWLFILCLTWTVNANSLKQNIIVIKEICSFSCHLSWMNRRRFCVQKGGSEEYISLITIMFCFNELNAAHRQSSRNLARYSRLSLYVVPDVKPWILFYY